MTPVISRPSLWVASPNMERFVYVDLHGFYRVQSINDFNQMTRVLANCLLKRWDPPNAYRGSYGLHL